MEKKITERWLSRQLRPHGIRPRTIWVIPDKRHRDLVQLRPESGKGYLREDFEPKEANH